MSLYAFCHEAVDTATANESAYVAAERMHQRTVGALVVVDESNAPVGIVTDRDLVIRVIAAGRDPYTTSVQGIMTPFPKTIPTIASLDDALKVMRAGEFRRLPIVSELGHLVGIVAIDDILSLISEEMSMVAGLLQRETPQAAATST